MTEVFETQTIASLQHIAVHLDSNIITETCVETQCFASQKHNLSHRITHLKVSDLKRDLYTLITIKMSGRHPYEDIRATFLKKNSAFSLFLSAGIYLNLRAKVLFVFICENLRENLFLLFFLLCFSLNSRK